MKHRLGSKASLKLIIILFFFLSILLIKSVFLAQKPTFLFGYTFLMIDSQSMEPNYPQNSVLVVKKTDIKELQVGDTVVFESNAMNGGLVFHRIVKITEEGCYTKGDNNKYGDNELITQSKLVGVCVYSTDIVARFNKSISSPLGFLIFIILPVALGFALKFGVRLLKKEVRKG